MLTHKNCKNLINMATKINILAFPILTKKGLRAGLVINEGGAADKQFNLYCPFCEKDIKMEEIECTCQQCGGKAQDIQNLGYPKVGAFIIICKDCAKEIGVEIEPLVKILKGA